MEVLYQSKGISKTSVTKKSIFIILCIGILIVLAFSVNAKVKGPSQSLVIGGSIHNISLEHYRYSSEKQEVITVWALTFAVIAIVEMVVLKISKDAWAEIDQDFVKANYMGKTINYSIANITKISEVGDYIFISGSEGKVVLIVEDAKKVHSLLNQLIENRKFTSKKY